MPYIEGLLAFYIRSAADFPLMFDSSLEKTIEFISSSIHLEASVSEESKISFDFSDWAISKVVRSGQIATNLDRGTATVVWTVEAIISHPSEMSEEEILQEIHWVVIPNTVWDDEIEVTVLTCEVI